MQTRHNLMVYYFKSPVSGRTTFVKFNEVKGKNWSNQTMPVLKESVPDLRDFTALQGCRVELNGHFGKIVDCCPYEIKLSGKYSGDGKYFQHSRLLQMNHMVLVHWESGMNYGWQRFDDLKLMKNV